VLPLVLPLVQLLVPVLQLVLRPVHFRHRQPVQRLMWHQYPYPRRTDVA
jgi:hypothetical protein